MRAAKIKQDFCTKTMTLEIIIAQNCEIHPLTKESTETYEYETLRHKTKHLESIGGKDKGSS